MFIEKSFIPTNDYVFKRIFGHVGNEKITKGLLTSILKRDLESINLDGNTILEKDLHDDKVGILDIKATLDTNIFCNIEMQVINNKNIEKRLLYYWSKLYSSSINEGDDYVELNKVISILITNFELDKLNIIPKYHTEWKIREIDFSKIILTEVLELHIIELPKLEKLLKNNQILENDKLSIWAKFLLNPDELEVTDLENNEDIKEAKKEFDEIRNSEYERRMAELRMKHIRDSKAIEAYGFDKGLEQGIQSEKREIAKKLVKRGMNIEDIIELTGLTKEEIEQI